MEKCTSPLQGSHWSRKNSRLVLREDNWRREVTQGTPLHRGAKTCIRAPTAYGAFLATAAPLSIHGEDVSFSCSKYHPCLRACILSRFCCVRWTLRPYRRYSASLLCPWNSPGENTGVDCLFPTPGNLPHSAIEPALLCLLRLAGGFFTTTTTWETQVPSLGFI